jgi:hypothetical protein
MPPAQSLRPAAYGYSRRTILDDAVIIGEQEEKMASYAAIHLPNFEYMTACVDETDQRTRFLPDRPQGHAVIMVGLERGDHLLVAQYRRAFRRPSDLANLLAVLDARGCHLHILDLGANPLTEAGRTVLAALRVLAEADKAAAKEKARDQMRRRRIEGKMLNGEAGPGFRLVGPVGNRRRVPDNHERTVQRKIIHWRRSGCTWHGIYYHMLRYKVLTSRGREWSMGKICRAYEAGLRLEAEEKAHEEPAPEVATS